MKKRISTLVVLLLLSSCAGNPTHHNNNESVPSSQSSAQRETELHESRVQSGLASWYGKRFRGRKTASGQRFDPKQLTAAHRTLPLGSKAKVTCLKTGKSVVVTVNDRGPYNSKRVIDLSHAAAKLLGITRLGVAMVEIEPL